MMVNTTLTRTTTTITETTSKHFISLVIYSCDYFHGVAKLKTFPANLIPIVKIGFLKIFIERIKES